MTEGRDSLERWLIGAAVSSKAALPAVASRLKDYDFTGVRAGVYAAILRLVSENRDVDEVAMLEPCNAVGAGAWEELNACVSEYFAHEYQGNLSDKILTLANLSDKNYLAGGLKALGRQVESGKLELMDAISKTQALHETTSKRHNRTQDVPIAEHVFSAMQAYRNKEGRQTGLFDIPALDKMLGTIRQGELVVVAARPAVGKTALAIYPALRVARAGKKVGLIATEMTVEQVAMRMLANMSGVYFAGVAGDEPITPTQEKVLGENVAILKQMTNLFVMEGTFTPMQIDAFMQRHEDAGDPVRLLIIDYIQMLTPNIPSKQGNNVADLTEIVKAIKSMAVKRKCVVIAMAQLNRFADPFTEPEMSQLKGCGELEQAADRIIGLYKDKNDPATTHMSLIKNRHGSLGHISMKFYGSTLRFFGEA